MLERTLDIPDAAERENLAAFVSRAVRLDPAAVVRIRRRDPDRLTVWCTTAGFEALAVRVVGGRAGQADTCVAADGLLRALQDTADGQIDPGFSMDSAWRGSLPPEDGFVHVDDVPARELVDLSVQGAELAREHSTSVGPPKSLLDQEVVHVEGGGEAAAVPLRCVFALTAMGFIPGVTQNSSGRVDATRLDAAEPVRVRATKNWLRLDARYGSVFHRRAGGLALDVL
ncbi:hypothetical protein G4X40_00350 [Rhodococcus sp. D2-41]|uniref:Uncharacterized protein n=1 Tax=Speluncibacter jeojiensis TaxID=2710754 RepID=A0A9X4RC47_9ACTN|nr:hypothetical protein [Rhodococcus sp. D2-41]MDG3008600.1 hypothetical protein [Rhodococcus sp. D2-41]MDG3013193.1 hypothetical protein [Corynebacteriales bacterium D3-21]